MHVVVNQKLVSTRVQIASAAHLAALAVFALGLFVSWSNPEPTMEQMAGAYAAIIIGLVLYNVGQFFLRRFGPRFRADGILAQVPSRAWTSATPCSPSLRRSCPTPSWSGRPASR